MKHLYEKRVKLNEDVKAILDKADAEKRAVTPEEQESIRKMDAEIDAIKTTIELRERQEAEERTLGESRGRQTETVVSDARPDPELALRAWVLGGDPRYVTEEMRSAAAHFGVLPTSRELNLRALSVGTTTAGGNAVPNEVMRAFMEIEKYYGRVQNVATVINTTTGATLPYPTMNDTGNTGRLLAEATGATTTTDPSVGVVNLASYKFSSDAVIVSVELLQDASFNVAQYLGAALATRIGRVKNTYFTTGTGTSQPKGINIAATTGKTASATNAITFDEIIDLTHSVDIAYRSDPSCGFMMHDLIAAYVRKLKDSNNQYYWQMAVQAGQPDRLLGFPVNINNDMPSTVATGNEAILFGAFSKYVVRIAGDVQILRSDDLYILNHQSVFLGFQRADGNLVDTTAVKALSLA